MLHITLKCPQARLFQQYLGLEGKPSKSINFPWGELRIAFSESAENACNALIWLHPNEALSRNAAQPSSPFEYLRFPAIYQNSILLTQGLDHCTSLLGEAKWEELQGFCHFEWPRTEGESTAQGKAWLEAAGFDVRLGANAWEAEAEGRLDEALRKLMLLIPALDPEAGRWLEPRGKAQIQQLFERWLPDHAQLPEILAHLHHPYSPLNGTAFLFQAYYQEFSQQDFPASLPPDPALMEKVVTDLESLGAQQQLHFCLTEGSVLEAVYQRLPNARLRIAAPRIQELESLVAATNSLSLSDEAKSKLEVLPLSPVMKHPLQLEQDAILFWNTDVHITKAQLADLTATLLEHAQPRLLVLHGCRPDSKTDGQLLPKHVQNWAKEQAEPMGYLHEFAEGDSGQWLLMFHQNKKS